MSELGSWPEVGARKVAALPPIPVGRWVLTATSKDYREGVQASSDRRDPNFSGT